METIFWKRSMVLKSQSAFRWDLPLQHIAGAPAHKTAQAEAVSWRKEWAWAGGTDLRQAHLWYMQLITYRWVRDLADSELLLILKILSGIAQGKPK